MKSRSKQKKLTLFKLKMLVEDESVRYIVARKTCARKWLLRRQEKSAFCTIFEELTMEDSKRFCEITWMPYAKLKFQQLAAILSKSRKK